MLRFLKENGIFFVGIISLGAIVYGASIVGQAPKLENGVGLPPVSNLNAIEPVSNNSQTDTSISTAQPGSNSVANPDQPATQQDIFTPSPSSNRGDSEENNERNEDRYDE